jgi:hypothetical protein
LQVKLRAGHRRINACKAVGLEEVPVEVKEYSDLLVIESNRYREKTWNEKLAEADALEKILRPKAKENIRATQKNVSASAYQKSDKQVDVLKQTAKSIAKEKPELIKAINEGKRTVHSAYNQIQQEKQRIARVSFSCYFNSSSSSQTIRLPFFYFRAL